MIDPVCVVVTVAVQVHLEQIPVIDPVCVVTVALQVHLEQIPVVDRPAEEEFSRLMTCLLYTSPSPRD